MPPEGVTAAVPSPPPLQLTSVVMTPVVSSVGSLINTESMAVHELSSVMVTP